MLRNQRGKHLVKLIDTFNISIINDLEPTFKRSNNVLDLAIVSDELLCKTSEFNVHKNIAISDHYPISFVLNDMIQRSPYSITNWKKLKEKLLEIEQIDDQNIEDTKQLEQEAIKFSENLTKLIVDCTYDKTNICGKINLPKNVLFSIKEKKKLLREYSKTHDARMKNKLNNLSNEIKREIKQLQFKKWNAMYESLNKSNPSERKYWKCLNASNEIEHSLFFLKN